MAPVPHTALSVIVRAGQPSSDEDAPSQPPSPLLRDGCTLLDPTPTASRGPASAAPSPPNGLLGSGAGLCRLACGATAEESADSKRVRKSGSYAGGCTLQRPAVGTALRSLLFAVAALWILQVCAAFPPTPAASLLPCATLPVQMQRKLIAALCLAFVFMLVEVAGGIYAHSLAM